ncbi:MAG: futalosine hydrolase [Niabella sp.]|nr:futalosine hydrolase [Niabella sp.]
MNVLVVAATKFEIPQVLQFSKKQPAVDVLITGIGAVATTYAVMKAVANKKYDCLLQAGIGGCFSRAIPLGSAVVVGTDCFGDLGVFEQTQFRSVFDMGLTPPDEKPFRKGWLQNPHKSLLKETGLAVVKGVTVNEITTNKKIKDYLSGTLEAVVESMEGAAFHYVALKEKIPFLQLRTLSNYVGERDKAKWKLKESVNVLNTTVEQLMLRLTKKIHE